MRVFPTINLITRRYFAEKSIVPLPFPVSGISGRYVQATYSAAIEKNVAIQVCDDASKLKKLIDTNRNLYDVLLNPMVDRVGKSDLVAAICKELHISPIMAETMKVVLANKREKLLPRILSNLENIGTSLRGEVKCTITVAKPLQTSEKTDILNALKGLLKAGHSLDAKFKIDPDIIGGCQVEIGDRYVDLSFRTQLEEYRKALQES